MELVAILTKDILSEAALQNKFQLLGYEVFCSKMMLEQVLAGKGQAFLDLFPILVISPTVYLSRDIRAIVQASVNRPNMLIQVLKDDLAVANANKIGVHQRIKRDCSLTELKEALVSVEGVLAEKRTDQDLELCKKKFIASLSKNEYKVFMILLNSQGSFIKRDHLSKLIWPGDVTNSRLVQLSQLIAKIRKKMDDVGFSEESLDTHWAKGYSVSTDLFS